LGKLKLLEIIQVISKGLSNSFNYSKEIHLEKLKINFKNVEEVIPNNNLMSTTIFENNFAKDSAITKKTTKEDTMKKLIQQKQDSYNCYQSSYFPEHIDQLVQQQPVVNTSVPDSWDDQLDDDDEHVNVILNLDQSKKVSKKIRKTIPCRFAESCKREVCNFAHSIAELDVVKCKRGNQCVNDSCIFYHPCDTIEQHFNRLKPTANVKKDTIVKSSQDKSKTAMCSFGKECKREVCNFAHSIEELRVFECTFAKTCRNGDRCTYFHPEKESKEQFVERKFGVQSNLVQPKINQPKIDNQVSNFPPLTKVSQQSTIAPWSPPPNTPQPEEDATIVIQCSKENFMDVLKKVQGQSNVKIQIV